MEYIDFTYVSKLDNLYLSGRWCGVPPRNRHQKKHHVFERDWSTCSKYDKHSQFNNQHKRGTIYDHFVKTTISTLIMEKRFQLAPNIMRRVANNLDLDLLTISCFTS